MKKQAFISLLGFIFLLSAFTLNGDTKTITESGIQISYPSNWNRHRAEGYDVIVGEPAPADRMAVMCNFVVETDEKYNTLETYLPMWEERFSKTAYLKNFKIVKRKTIDFKGFEAEEIITSCSMQGFDAKSKIILLEQNGRVVNLSMTSGDKVFKKNLKVTKPIFESVVFK